MPKTHNKLEPERAKGSKLLVKVQQLSVELSQMRKPLLVPLPGTHGYGAPAEWAPTEDDAISIAASATLFGASDIPSQVWGRSQEPQTQSSSQGSEEDSMGAIIRGALAHLQIACHRKAFFR